MGPLKGVRVIEIASIGPGPFCAMMLADLGAQVVRVERIGGSPLNLPVDLMNRGRQSVGVNLKHPRGSEVVLDLVRGADILIEGFRPGVAERLGIGPEPCLEANPRLVYGRITGWGQDGPLAPRAGHDLNYIALSGALHPIGPRDGAPVVPLNLIGDFGGGGMLLAFGVLAAALEAQRSGKGQVVDAAMIDGAATLTTMFHGMMASDMWKAERESNMLDGGSPFYSVYETKDGKHMSVGCLEPKFFASMIQVLELDPATTPGQFDQDRWPQLRAILTDTFATKTRDEWAALFEPTDACVYPVLSLPEAPVHPHLSERQTFIDVDGVVQPAPAPRFSRTPNAPPAKVSQPGEHTDRVLQDAGYDETRIAELKTQGVVG